MSLKDRSKAEILERYRLSELMAGNLRLQLQSSIEVSRKLAEALQKLMACSSPEWCSVCMDRCRAALAQYTAGEMEEQKG